MYGSVEYLDQSLWLWCATVSPIDLQGIHPDINFLWLSDEEIGIR